MTKEIILFEADDKSIKMPVSIEKETVWLSANQMAELFERDAKTIRRHINNVLREGELNASVVAFFATTAADGKVYQVEHYDLDMIISVGYRVKSKRGVEFRRWANSVLKDYILKGYAKNNRRLEQLGKVLSLMKRAQDALDAEQVLDVIGRYNTALELLDDYDHQSLARPDGNTATYILDYDECRALISKMYFNENSTLFGTEKDNSFRSSITAIYQTFDGKELYPSLEEKAANLLYFITKNHSFNDGNKRIAATIFLYFLERNGVLFKEGHKLIDDHTLVALTLLVAESNPDEKEMMVSAIMNCIAK